VVYVRRNDLDVCAYILGIARGGATETKIVEKAGLDSPTGLNYLKRLIECGYLHQMGNMNYVTTKKGSMLYVKYLDILKDLYYCGMLKV
jgi:predicted transcriptional regulator